MDQGDTVHNVQRCSMSVLKASISTIHKLCKFHAIWKFPQWYFIEEGQAPEQFYLIWDNTAWDEIYDLNQSAFYRGEGWWSETKIIYHINICLSWMTHLDVQECVHKVRTPMNIMWVRQCPQAVTNRHISGDLIQARPMSK